jgi:hypothetical protein
MQHIYIFTVLARTSRRIVKSSHASTLTYIFMKHKKTKELNINNHKKISFFFLFLFFERRGLNTN